MNRYGLAMSSFALFHMLFFAACSTSEATVPEAVDVALESIYPPNGATFQVEGPGPYNVPGATNTFVVDIVGPENTTYLEVHAMNLRLDDTVIDSDSGSGLVATNNMGLWEHYAHGNGQLYGERLVGQGTHTVRAAGQIRASRFPNGRDLFANASWQNQFTIVQIG